MVIEALHRAFFCKLYTERLILRALTMEDAEAMFLYTSCIESFRFLRREHHRSVDEDQRFIQNVLDGYRMHREFVWGICLYDESNLVGTCRMFNFQLIENGCEVSYLINPAYKCQGIASEAVGKLIQYALDEMNLVRVQAWCAVENFASERVMQKCGMVKEKNLPHFMELHGVWHDAVQYGIEKKR